MRIAKSDIPVKVDASPMAKACQQIDFGDATAYGMLAAEHMVFAEGADLAELLKGLEGDLCQSPHWGYMIEGRLVVNYGDGSTETISGGDFFYFPPGHTVRAEQATEIVMFSPQHEHCKIIDHILGKIGGG